MSQPIEKKRKLVLVKNEDDDRTGSQGSQGGAIQFQDFVNLNGSQLLSKEEERQKLIEHEAKTSGLVDKQKKLRDQRKDVTAGQTAAYQYGSQSNRNSTWAKHPIIGESAEFDGADPQMSLDPNRNEAETNADKKQELTYQHQHRLGLENQPKISPPTFKPPGS